MSEQIKKVLEYLKKTNAPESVINSVTYAQKVLEIYEGLYGKDLKSLELKKKIKETLGKTDPVLHLLHDPSLLNLSDRRTQINLAGCGYEKRMLRKQH